MANTKITRQMRAQKLLRDLERGPTFAHLGDEAMSPQEAAQAYSLWVRHVVMSELRSLVPELRT